MVRRLVGQRRFSKFNFELTLVGPSTLLLGSSGTSLPSLIPGHCFSERREGTSFSSSVSELNTNFSTGSLDVFDDSLQWLDLGICP
jgi:hypothetical protein